jgi:hypothetical protein
LTVNFQQAQQQIREMGSQASLRREKIKELEGIASHLLDEFAGELDTLEQLVARAVADNNMLRCAAPYHETLNTAFPEPPQPTGYTLLAADGSQINPVRHAMVEFGAINVGAIRMTPGQGEPAQEVVQSRLMFHDDLFTANGKPLTEELVALKRDLAERKMLAQMARAETGPVLALTDGPLELFREPKGMPEFETEMERYTNVLEDLADMGAGAAGYVDRPSGDLVVRLLELVILQRRGQLNRAGDEHPLRGVLDRRLFWSLLGPGERSAIFAIRSGSSRSFQGRLALHFFYLNVGRAGKTYLARVEIPAWVAQSPALVDLLHACLLGQARHLGNAPYPYVLHRAHEIAVVSKDEHSQLESMIAAELRRQGMDVEDVSNKQGAKNNSNTHTAPTRAR